MNASLFWLVFSGIYTPHLSLKDIAYREAKCWLIPSAWRHITKCFYQAIYCQTIAFAMLGIEVNYGLFEVE